MQIQRAMLLPIRSHFWLALYFSFWLVLVTSQTYCIEYYIKIHHTHTQFVLAPFLPINRLSPFFFTFVFDIEYWGLKKVEEGATDSIPAGHKITAKNILF